MKKRYVVLVLFVGVMGLTAYRAIDYVLRPDHYAALQAKYDAERAEVQARQDAEAAEKAADQAEERRQAELTPMLRQAALDMFSARSAYPEATREAVEAYNRRLAAAVTRWRNLQEQIHGPGWERTYVMNNRLSVCGLHGMPRMPCLNAPIDTSSVPSVANSMLPMPREVEPQPVPMAAPSSAYAVAPVPPAAPEPVQVAVITTNSEQPG